MRAGFRFSPGRWYTVSTRMYDSRFRLFLAIAVVSLLLSVVVFFQLRRAGGVLGERVETFGAVVVRYPRDDTEWKVATNYAAGLSARVPASWEIIDGSGSRLMKFVSSGDPLVVFSAYVYANPSLIALDDWVAGISLARDRAPRTLPSGLSGVSFSTPLVYEGETDPEADSLGFSFSSSDSVVTFTCSSSGVAYLDGLRICREAIESIELVP